MITTHMFLGSKGGIGKSLCSAQLASYLIHKGLSARCFDTDPLNHTLGDYSAFPVKVLNLMDVESQQINPRAFDTFMEHDMMTLPDGTHAVIDNGSSTYLPWCAYMAENPVFSMLTGMGQEVLIHAIVTGGQALGETYGCLAKLMNAFPQAPFVVWMNRYFGPIEKDGVPFEQSELFIKNANKIHAVVKIPHLNVATYGKDIEELLVSKMTVAQAAQSGKFGVMPTQRLIIFERLMNEAIENACIA